MVPLWSAGNAESTHPVPEIVAVEPRRAKELVASRRLVEPRGISQLLIVFQACARGPESGETSGSAPAAAVPRSVRRFMRMERILLPCLP